MSYEPQRQRSKPSVKDWTVRMGDEQPPATDDNPQRSECPTKPICERCGAHATTGDSEGVALCEKCYQWQQLAAAVKPYNDGWLDQAARDSREIVRLETELAAEQEETEKYQALASERWNQLADEREKRKPLVEALELVRKALRSGGGLREVTDIIDDALANVKDGK